jgi:hypothetical protein
LLSACVAVAKLKEAGCGTVGLLISTPIKELAKVKGLSEAKITKMLDAASKVTSGTLMIAAADF